MGAGLSKVTGKLFGNKYVKLHMTGLDSTGKTTILYRLKLDLLVATIPTKWPNIEHVSYKNLKFLVRDAGGLVFMVDSNDRDRVDEAKVELHRMLDQTEMKIRPLLVFANKQDLPGSMSTVEVTERLGLYRLRDRSWRCLPCCATTGEGLYEGLQWLSQNAKESAT